MALKAAPRAPKKSLCAINKSRIYKSSNLERIGARPIYKNSLPAFDGREALEASRVVPLVLRTEGE